jgi:hypothetical protein
MAERRTSLTSALLLAALTEVVVLVGAFLTTVLTDWAGRAAWLVAPVIGVTVAMGKILVSEVASSRRETGERVAAEREAASRPPLPGGRQRPPHMPPPRRRPVPTDRRRRGTPVAVAVVVVLLVMGVGGWGLAQGVRHVAGWVSGDEEGTERLAAPVSVTDQGLTLSVDSVVHTPRFTRVGILVTNGLANTVTLPVSGNAHLSAEGGRTIEGDGFRSDFSDTLPPGAVRDGILVFPGHLSEGPTVATLSFATVFEQGFDGPDSLSLPGIQLSAVE